MVAEEQGDGAILELPVGVLRHVLRRRALQVEVDQLAVLGLRRPQFAVAWVAFVEVAPDVHHQVGQRYAAADFRLALHVARETLRPVQHLRRLERIRPASLDDHEHLFGSRVQAVDQGTVTVERSLLPEDRRTVAGIPDLDARGLEQQPRKQHHAGGRHQIAGPGGHQQRSDAQYRSQDEIEIQRMHETLRTAHPGQHDRRHHHCGYGNAHHPYRADDRHLVQQRDRREHHAEDGPGIGIQTEHAGTEQLGHGLLGGAAGHHLSVQSQVVIAGDQLHRVGEGARRDDEGHDHHQRVPVVAQQRADPQRPDAGNASRQQRQQCAAPGPAEDEQQHQHC
ncbi:hypothetical protein D9M68_519680 [compost metagenome]